MDSNIITRLPTNYTAVISCTKPILRESAPIVKLVKAISTAAHLERIVIVWMGSGSPRLKMPELAVPVLVVTESGADKWTRQFWPDADIRTEAVLHLSEDVEMTSDEVKGCMYVCCVRERKGEGGGGREREREREKERERERERERGASEASKHQLQKT